MIDSKAMGKAIIFIENNLFEPIAPCDVAKALTLIITSIGIFRRLWGKQLEAI